MAKRLQLQGNTTIGPAETSASTRSIMFIIYKFTSNNNSGGKTMAKKLGKKEAED